MLSRRLQRDGYRVVVAHHGKQALEIAAAKEIDLVLLDVMMPVMDGYETLARFKASEELRHIPIIMLTSLDEQGSLATCIEAGAEDHLPKPFDPVLLRARLSGSLERKRSRDREREYLAQIVAEKRRADDLIHGVIPIGVALAGERNEARILARTLIEARRFCGADGGMLQLLENDELIVVQMQCESMQQSVSPTATRPPSASGGVPQRVNLKDEGKSRRPEVMAASQGLTINIDVVSDPADYDLSAVRAFDQSNAYRTRSIVFVPLRASAESDVSGVLQLWNATRPTDGAAIPFTTTSVEMLQSLSSLAAAALQAYRRERELRHRIRRLEIKIDERERGTEVAQITETDYFKRLRKQARELRKRSS
ncbi:MAG: response regulator [Nannocystaceae bacterium]|nr:response regulator [Nannocystaceae bacterium]